MRRDFGNRYVDRVDLRGVRQLVFATPTASRRRSWRCSKPASSTSRRSTSREFKSVISQMPTALQLIPAKIPAARPKKRGAGAIHDYEPDEEEILGYLVTRNISTQIFRGLLENVASFYGAQMSAMD